MPLFQVSRDDEMLVRYKAGRFSSNLTEGALAWLGIVTEEVPHARDLFRQEDDADVDGIVELLHKRRSDPAMVLWWD